MQRGWAVAEFDVPLTRREAVARQLREEIVSGGLPPGTLLKDGELAARLGMSITPVREAITQLAAEGLVDISPNRTRKVAGFTLKSALDLVDVMELLACAGFDAGLENLTGDHLSRLRTRYEEFTEALKRDDTAMAQSSGADFSSVVILAGGNVELQAMVDQVVLRTLRLLRLNSDSDLWAPWIEGYRDVLDLLEQGNRPAAQARYRQIYPAYRAAVERAFSAPLPGNTAPQDASGPVPG
jgi:DNA-binding GntR family transcriptional regulator